MSSPASESAQMNGAEGRVVDDLEEPLFRGPPLGQSATHIRVHRLHPFDEDGGE